MIEGTNARTRPVTTLPLPVGLDGYVFKAKSPPVESTASRDTEKTGNPPIVALGACSHLGASAL
ncbi:MAG TPA: hypothetical protein VGI66_00130 [Streptosporangiaceae bacterium]|jgi:hypothetical protein